MNQECGNCQHFLPHRYTNGRINYKHFGTCNYVITWPKVPMNYKPLPKKADHAVWIDSNAESCDCYFHTTGQMNKDRS